MVLSVRIELTTSVLPGMSYMQLNLNGSFLKFAVSSLMADAGAKQPVKRSRSKPV